MFLVEQVTLTNFKCYSQSKYEFNPGFNLIVRPNGHGKTALVEGIAYALAGSTAVPRPAGEYIREGSFSPSYVLLKGYLRQKQFSLKRGLKPRNALLKWGDISETKVTEIQRLVKEFILPPQLVRTTICCFQREAALIARADANTRRKFIMNLLRLDVVERALKSLTSASSSSLSLRALEEQLSKCQDDLSQFEVVDESLEPVMRKQLELIRLKKTYDPDAAQKRTRLQEQLNSLRALYQLLQAASSVDSLSCPLCGSTKYSRDYVVKRTSEVHRSMAELSADLSRLPPPCVVSPDAFSNLVPGLDEKDCVKYLDLITQKRVKRHTLDNLKEAIRSARSSKSIHQARGVLRDFLTWLSGPLVRSLSVYTSHVLKMGMFETFELDATFNIKVDGRDFSLLSTGQQDYVAASFRVAVSYLLSLLYRCPRMPLILDSVGDSLDDAHYSALMDYLSGGATKLFSQVVVTSHRSD
ncbi:hypothetical protein DRO59_07240 [Candidatus Bathyarchaeota archaeon]|nr:MAG: hypothetical protein DRO59_07240 [Candidatus Bathyarchaeota archaeon]